MQNSDLEQFKVWFAKYTASHFGDDPYINANLQLKKDHSARVCGEMNCLVDALGLDDNDKLIARTAALFHDVGRFPQFVKYQTYMDPRSCDHSCLSVSVLQNNEVMGGLSDEEQRFILTSIRLHGQKLLPDDLDDRTALFAKLVRDADKLDVFFFIIEMTKAYLADPNSFLLELELPDDPFCTDEIAQSVIDGKLIDYNKLRTMSDMRMMQLGWVYDINFTPTFERIAEQKYLEQIAEYLPKTPQTEKAIEQVLKYVDEHIR